jgi:hypothetical protein
VDLVQQRELIASLEALDHPDLPERPRAVERARGIRLRAAQLLECARARERERVVADVEVAVVDPHRPALERRPRELGGSGSQCSTDSIALR